MKDILNRNGIGLSKEPVNTGQPVVNINIRKHEEVRRMEGLPGVQYGKEEHFADENAGAGYRSGG